MVIFLLISPQLLNFTLTLLGTLSESERQTFSLKKNNLCSKTLSGLVFLIVS